MNKDFLDRSGEAIVTVRARSVTEQKAADDVISEPESRLRAVIESTADAIITTDLMGNVLFWNGAAEKMFGYRKAEIIGSPLALLVPEPRREIFSSGMQEVGSEAYSTFFGKTFERQGRRKDGSVFPAEVSVSAWEGRPSLSTMPSCSRRLSGLTWSCRRPTTPPWKAGSGRWTCVTRKPKVTRNG